MDHDVRDNPQRERYELHVGGRLVTIADYRRDGDVIVVPHVETEPQMRGRGMADRLMRGMLDQLRSQGLSIRPLCPYAADFIRKHPTDHDLTA